MASLPSMQRTGIDRPWAFAVSVTAVSVSILSMLGWSLICLAAMFSDHVDERWIYTGLLMPGAVLGGLAWASSGRRTYFVAGLLLALVPVIACVALAIATPDLRIRVGVD